MKKNSKKKKNRYEFLKNTFKNINVFVPCKTFLWNRQSMPALKTSSSEVFKPKTKLQKEKKWNPSHAAVSSSLEWVDEWTDGQTDRQKWKFTSRRLTVLNRNETKQSVGLAEYEDEHENENTKQSKRKHRVHVVRVTQRSGSINRWSNPQAGNAATEGANGDFNFKFGLGVCTAEPALYQLGPNNARRYNKWVSNPCVPITIFLSATIPFSNRCY